MNLEFEKLDLSFAVYPVNTAYGAPMGRASGVFTRDGYGHRSLTLAYNDLPFKLYLQKVSFIDGAYDREGAYWGSPCNLYAAFCLAYCPKVDREFEVRIYVRASSREAAKVSVLAELPNATFYR